MAWWSRPKEGRIWKVYRAASTCTGRNHQRELSRCSCDHEIESEQTRSEPFTNLDGCHSLQLYEKASKIPQCPRFGWPRINTLATTLSYFLFFSQRTLIERGN
jgi:hypothetical protein